jgi:cyclase
MGGCRNIILSSNFRTNFPRIHTKWLTGGRNWKIRLTKHLLNDKVLTLSKISIVKTDHLNEERGELMQQVTENIFVETGYRGCNPGFIVTSDGLVQIDTPHRPTDGIEYKKAVEEYGSVKYLINTEPHGDHFSSNFLFEATFVAHRDTRARMTDKAFMDRMKQMLIMIDPDYAPYFDDYSVPLPEITFTDSMVLFVGEHTLKLMHLPGHTASQTAVFIPEEKVVFTGDNIFNKSPTFMHEALPKEW